MRKSVVITSLVAAASVTVGLAGVTQATSSPAAAPPPSFTVEEVLANLTPEQISCVGQNAAGVDPNDTTAVLGVLETCGINVDDLLGSTGTPLSSDPLSTDVTGLPAGDPFANIGIDAATEVCIAGSVAATPPADDNAALAILTSCGASLVDIVTLIGGGTPGGATTPTTPTGTTATSSGTSSDPFVEILRTELEKNGIFLEDAQLQCLTDAVLANPDADFQDSMVLLPILDQCDVDLSDLGG